MKHAIRNANYTHWSMSTEDTTSSKGGDVLLFPGDTGSDRQHAVQRDPWHVLIVDDDPGVHQATLFALQRIKVLDRPLNFLHAHSSEEALNIMRERRDIAVVLLDVVMEHEAAGLAAVGAIRGELGNAGTRIILRTGQPGYAPETETMLRYDINGYATKGELTRNRLLTAITSAIRSYDQIMRLEISQAALRELVSASYRLMAEADWQRFANTLIGEIATLLGVAPNGMVCSLPHRSDSFIVSAAAGTYAGHLGSRVTALPEALRANITTCLEQRARLQKDECLYFHFSHHAGGEFVAVLETGAALSSLDPQLLDIFALTVAVCGDNVRLVETLRDIAYVDTLVTLPNRAAFLQGVDERIRHTQADGHVVALVDIDQFAEVNEMFGYQHGDRLLQAVASRLGQHLSAAHQLARVGSNAFALFAPESALTPATLSPLLRSSYEIDRIDCPATLSVGFARYIAGSSDANSLLQEASLALKRAKAAGYGQCAFYSTAIADETRVRTQLLHNLSAAMHTEQLFLAYQPQMDLKRNEVCGVEALLRWRQTDGTMVPPDRFIPIAEQSGLIIEMGQWVMRTALRDLRALHAAGYAGLHMAVNVSAIELGRPNFLQQVESVLSDSAVQPQQLEIEVTESEAMVDAMMVQKTLQALRQHGIQVAIDDFGTGYSSLAYLDRLPATRLKIDRAFVQVLGTPGVGAHIAEVVIPLGQRLGMKVLAEGVETEAQLAHLQQLGCDETQGYLHARPMPLDELMVWLAARSKS